MPENWFTKNAPNKKDWFAANSPSSQGVTVEHGDVRPMPLWEDLKTTRPVGVTGESLGENATNAVANIGAGVFQGIDALIHPGRTVRGLVASVLPDPVVRLINKSPDAAGRELPEGTQNPLQSVYEGVNTRPGETIPPMVGQTAVFEGAGAALGLITRGLASTAAKARGGLAAKYGPREVPVGNGTVPVMVGEAEPESAAGRTQAQLKRSGAGAPKFEKVEKAQQEAAKNVIKHTAQKASGFIGPMQEEAGAVVDDAATASFRKAEPLYSELDQSLKQIPAGFQNVSKIVQDAIAKARKLGVVIDDGAGDISKIRPDKDGAIQWGGSKISKATHPERWNQLVQEGIIDDSGNSTPFRAYRQVRSQLLKMQRSATDEAIRFAIGKEVESMDANIDAALKGSGLEKTWAEANRLWREGKARIKVAEAITDATKGTPESVQAPGMAKVPTKLMGASLVDKLNTLADDGTLEQAFTTEEVRNLRQSAEILDRIQKTPVGKGSGESMSFARGLTHAVRGFKGPVIGAIAGGAMEMLSGGSLLRGAEMGAGLGFIVQSIGERALVNVMTKLDGVKALEAVEKAKTPQDFDTAIHTLAILAATAPKGPKTRELEKLRDDSRATQ